MRAESRRQRNERFSASSANESLSFRSPSQPSHATGHLHFPVKLHPHSSLPTGSLTCPRLHDTLHLPRSTLTTLSRHWPCLILKHSEPLCIKVQQNIGKITNSLRFFANFLINLKNILAKTIKKTENLSTAISQKPFVWLDPNLRIKFSLLFSL